MFFLGCIIRRLEQVQATFFYKSLVPKLLVVFTVRKISIDGRMLVVD
jgi:hypothetical protein